MKYAPSADGAYDIPLRGISITTDFFKLESVESRAVFDSVVARSGVDEQRVFFEGISGVVVIFAVVGHRFLKLESSEISSSFLR